AGAGAAAGVGVCASAFGARPAATAVPAPSRKLRRGMVSSAMATSPVIAAPCGGGAPRLTAARVRDDQTRTVLIAAELPPESSSARVLEADQAVFEPPANRDSLNKCKADTGLEGAAQS